MATTLAGTLRDCTRLIRRRSSTVDVNDTTFKTEQWFADITHDRAERLLLQCSLPKGTYLIRERETEPGAYALTIRDEDAEQRPSVKHYSINRKANGRFHIAKRRTFASLRDLVDYYSGEQHGLCCALTFPAASRIDLRIDPVVNDLSIETQRNWEIPRENLNSIRFLGEGYFSEVWLGTWQDRVEVAIKKMKPGTTMSRGAFLEEASIMKRCSHPNLMELYAVCTQTEPIYIIMEYMPGGSLRDNLRNNAWQLQEPTLIEFSEQVACGMSYLEERRFVHRDLAARNVLVGVNNNVKVADFGLARVLTDRDIYRPATDAGVTIAIKWTAPEAINGTFTVKSDVWSFGILLHEVFTKGGEPYSGRISQPDVLHLTSVIWKVTLILDVTGSLKTELDRGYRMPKPRECPHRIYDKMIKCWNRIPDLRPSFEELYLFLDGLSSLQPELASNDSVLQL